MSMRIAAVLLLCATAAEAAENVETLTERSQARARAVVDRAADALGGAAALRGIKGVRLTLAGETWPRLQMPTAAPPFEAGRLDETLLLDLGGNRLKLEQRTDGAGFEGHNVIVIASAGGTNYDLRARVATPIPTAQSSQQQFVQYYRRIPNLILRQALERATSLRHLGEDTFEGKPHDVVTFVMADGQQVGLYVDRGTALISKYELVFTDPLTGEEASEIVFGDYAKTGALTAPRRWEFRQAGDVLSKYALSVAFDPPLDAAAFAVAAESFRTAQAAPATLEPAVDELAPGVYVIRNVAGQNQNTRSRSRSTTTCSRSRRRGRATAPTTSSRGSRRRSRASRSATSR